MENIDKRPLLDTYVDSKELQILKTIIPYLKESQQRNIAMMVRFIELIKTNELFDAANNNQCQELTACACDTEEERMVKMFQAVKQYCSTKEQEQIDMILNFIEVSDGFKYF